MLFLPIIVSTVVSIIVIIVRLIIMHSYGVWLVLGIQQHSGVSSYFSSWHSLEFKRLASKLTRAPKKHTSKSKDREFTYKAPYNEAQ